MMLHRARERANLPTPRQLANQIWQGPATLTPPLLLEWRLIIIRWFGMAFVAPGLWLAQLSPVHLTEAYGIIVLAAIYNVVIHRLLSRRPELLVSGYLTAFGDGLLNIAMITVGGGFDSSFYFLLFAIIVSTAMRYGYGPPLALAGLVLTLDVLETGIARHALAAPIIFRSGFLVITAALAGYLRQQARQAEAELHLRLRHADHLNTATAMLGTSLEFYPALHAAAAAADHLFGGSCTVLQPSTQQATTFDDVPAYIVHSATATPDTALCQEIVGLCRPVISLETWQRGAGAPRQQLSLADGQQVIVFPLALPTRQAALATLAVCLPPGQLVSDLPEDILESFIERTTLAIENALLYRTLANRNDDLQRAYSDLAMAHQELLSIDEMKTNFLANVSHELRTPLSSIRSFSELLLSYDDPLVRQEFLQIINAESERLTRLVNDVLDISKIEAGQMDWQMALVNVVDLLHNCARPYARLAADHGLQFHEDIDPTLPPVIADGDRIQQVVSNLLNNAVKFTESGTIILRARRAGDELEIAVADTGIGIPPSEHARIFQKFQQVGDTLTEKPKGTGLGLAICQEIITHHQGRLWLESRVGEGSTFSFALPIPSAIAPTTPAVLAVAT